MNMIGKKHEKTMKIFTQKSESHFARHRYYRPLKGEPGMLHASAASRVRSVKDLLQLNDVESQFQSRIDMNPIHSKWI